jgi:hypothetical protein
MALALGSSSGERFGAQRAQADDAANLDVGVRARTAPRCRELGRPQFVELFNQSIGKRPEFDVEFVEILCEKIALELMFDRSSHEATQAAIADV